MKYTFKNGATVEGTVEQVLNVAKSLGEIVNLKGQTPEGYYDSEHSGLMKISDMDIRHIRNAMLKRVRKNVEILTKKTNLSEMDFRDKFWSLLGDDDILENLDNELENRIR